MKAYGVKRSDKICCAGHSKYSEMDNESTHAPRMRPAKKSARQKWKEAALKEWLQRALEEN